MPLEPEPFAIRLVEDGPEGVTLAVTGDLDLGTADTLRSAIDDHLGKPMIIDLAGVAFLDSTGMGVLLASNRRAHESGMEFRATNLQIGPRKVLEMSGVYPLLVGDDPEG